MTILYRSEMLVNTSTYVPMTMSTRLIVLKVLGFVRDISFTHTFKLLLVC